MPYTDMTCTALTSGQGDAITTSYTTASINPTANRLCLLGVYSAPNGGASPPNQPTVTGAGMTWVAVDDETSTGGSAGQGRLTVFRALKASPGTGALTIDFAGQQQVGCTWAVLQLTPVATSGTDGSGAIADSASGRYTPGGLVNAPRFSLAFDAGSLTDVNQRVVAFFHQTRDENTLAGLHASEVTETHFTHVGQYVTTMQTQVSLTDQVSATWFDPTGTQHARQLLGVAVIVNPASLYGTGPTDHPEFRLELSTANPDADTQTWYDISGDARHATIDWGRSNEDDEFGAGTQTYTLDNSSGDYRRSNTGGRFYPNLKRFRNVRSFLVWKGVRVWLAYGRIETIIPTREGDYGEVEMNCNDGREQLANMFLSSGSATVTMGGGKLAVTSRGQSELDTEKRVGDLSKSWSGEGGAGLYAAGAQSTVTLKLTQNQPVTSVDDSAGRVTVNLRSAAGVSLATGVEVATAINSHATAGRRLRASGTTGVVSSSSETPLAGAWSSELSGTRVNRALDNILWPVSHRVIDAGTRTIQASQFAVVDKVSITQHLRDIEVSEAGQVFVDPQRRIVFQGSGARAAAPFDTPLFTVVDNDPAAGEFWATEITPNEDSAFIRTQVTVSRAGGGSSTATADASHLAMYGTRDYSFDTILSTDTVLAARASAYLAAHQDEKDRYDQIVLDPVTAGVDIYDVLAEASVSHRVTVKENSYPGASALSSDHFIEGVHHELTLDTSPFHWVATYRLSPV